MAEGGIGPQLGPLAELDAHILLESAYGILESHGFVIFSPLSDRHGSWEITYHCLVNDIDRAVSIAFTNELPPSIIDTAQPWRVEIWIEAEFKERYLRRITRQFTATGLELNSGAFLNHFGQALQQSIKLVLALKLENLTAFYPRRKTLPSERFVDASNANLFKKNPDNHQ